MQTACARCARVIISVPERLSARAHGVSAPLSAFSAPCCGRATQPRPAICSPKPLSKAKATKAKSKAAKVKPKATKTAKPKVKVEAKPKSARMAKNQQE